MSKQGAAISAGRVEADLCGCGQSSIAEYVVHVQWLQWQAGWHIGGSRGQKSQCRVSSAGRGSLKVLSLHIGSIETGSPEKCSQVGLLDSKRSGVHKQLLVVPKHDEIIWQGLHMHRAKFLQRTRLARSDRSVLQRLHCRSCSCYLTSRFLRPAGGRNLEPIKSMKLVLSEDGSSARCTDITLPQSLPEITYMWPPAAVHKKALTGACPDCLCAADAECRDRGLDEAQCSPCGRQHHLIKAAVKVA